MYHTTEINIVICKNLASDASAELMAKVHEARGALEMRIRMGLLLPGEYVISRKGLKGNGALDWSTGCWGHTYASAVEANALYDTGLDGDPKCSHDHLSIWVNRTDGKTVFTSTKVNRKGEYSRNSYAALSSATHGLFTSKGVC